MLALHSNQTKHSDCIVCGRKLNGKQHSFSSHKCWLKYWTESTSHHKSHIVCMPDNPLHMTLKIMNERYARHLNCRYDVCKHSIVLGQSFIPVGRKILHLPCFNYTHVLQKTCSSCGQIMVFDQLNRRHECRNSRCNVIQINLKEKVVYATTI
jgi:predicted RNA-binding Zn-ribbon protein involved in translation (DUF1610 family)